jgi:hypothetical protein
MRIAIACISFLIAGSPAQAQKLRVLPPEEFDHPYTGPSVVVRARDQDHVREMCPGMKFNLGVALGCSFRRPNGVCLIIMAPDAVIEAAGHSPDVVYRHEMAHCNGWPADHRGAR